jgi:hypothetical protein
MPTTEYKADPKLEQAIQESIKYYAAGDERFFDLLDDDVRMYGVESIEPIVGRKAFQGNFAKNLAGTKREVSVLKSEVRPAGEYAVHNQTLQVTADGVSSILQQQVVWVQRPRGWLKWVVQSSLPARPVFTGPAPKTSQAVRVINERIATVAAVLGVAQ